jgi:hypothetical protein
VSWQDNPFKNQLKSLHLRGGCEEWSDSATHSW